MYGSAKSPGLLNSLNALRDERNRSAHGGTPQSLPECALRAAESGRHLKTAVTEAGFLTEPPWVLIRSTDYRPGTDTFEVTASLAMGGDPDFDLRHFSLTQPVGAELFYLLGHGNPHPALAVYQADWTHQPVASFSAVATAPDSNVADTCARHGIDRRQIDLSAEVTRAFERLGRAGEVRWTDPARLDARCRVGV